MCCKNCDRTLKPQCDLGYCYFRKETFSDLENMKDQLAAAKAELAAEKTKCDDLFEFAKGQESAASSAFGKLIESEQRAEQAEAQCAAMRNCDNCNKWCMKQPNKSEFDTLNRMDDCKFNNLSHWELSKKIKAALEDKP